MADNNNDKTAITPERKGGKEATNEVTPAEKQSSNKNERLEGAEEEDNAKRPHETTSPTRKQSPRVGGTPTRIKNMKNTRREFNPSS